jgi:hypothetical protein
MREPLPQLGKDARVDIRPGKHPVDLVQFVCA